MKLDECKKLAQEVLAAKRRRDALGAESCRHTIIDEACTIAHHNLVLARAVELAAIYAQEHAYADRGEVMRYALEQAELEVGDV